jgi:hypothetical protein
VQPLELKKLRVEVRDTQMAADDEDLPTTYLVYAAVVLVVLVVAAISTFLILAR